MHGSLDNDETHNNHEDHDRGERHRRFSISETMGKIWNVRTQEPVRDQSKLLSTFIRFSNEGIPTRAEQAKRERKLYEASGYTMVTDPALGGSGHGEVIGNIQSMPPSKSTKKGLEVSLVNGQIVLDRSSINRQVDHFDMNDSDDFDSDELTGKSSGQRKHKVVSWSIEETRQFYDCLRKYGTDFFMMNKVITNRTRKDLKNKYKTEERRNPKLVNMILAVHLKEKVQVPEVSDVPKETPLPVLSSSLSSTPGSLLPETSITDVPTAEDTQVIGHMEPLDKDNEDEPEIEGALSESSSESDSEDNLSMDDIL